MRHSGDRTNSSLRVGFVVQNETHAENFALMALDVRSRGGEVDVLCLDPTSGLRTLQHFPDGMARPLSVSSKSAFYRMSRRDQMRFMSEHAARIRADTPECDVLIVGNDGAIQRLLLRAARGQGARTALLLDGLVVGPRNWHESAMLRVRALLLRVATRLGLEHLSPGSLAHGSLDRVVVMHASLKRILEEDMRVRAEIRVAMLPRHRRLVETVGLIRRDSEAETRRILYASSAYLWHRLTTFHERQVAEVTRVVELATLHPKVEFRLRVHPREDLGDYGFAMPVNMSLSDSGVSLAEDLAWSSEVWTSRSSLSFEAVLCGVPTYISTEHFPPLDPRDFLAGLESVHVVPNFSKCLSLSPSTVPASTMPEGASALELCLGAFDPSGPV